MPATCRGSSISRKGGCEMDRRLCGAFVVSVCWIACCHSDGAVVEFPAVSPCRALTSGPQEHLLASYYGSTRGTTPQRYVTVLRTDVTDRIPTENDPATLAPFVDVRTKEFIPLTQTRAWNFQQGVCTGWARRGFADHLQRFPQRAFRFGHHGRPHETRAEGDRLPGQRRIAQRQRGGQHQLREAAHHATRLRLRRRRAGHPQERPVPRRRRPVPGRSRNGPGQTSGFHCPGQAAGARGARQGDRVFQSHAVQPGRQQDLLAGAGDSEPQHDIADVNRDGSNLQQCFPTAGAVRISTG